MSAIVGAIVARNGGAGLANALADLTAVCGVEGVLVVDNASHDGSTENLPVGVERWRENRGFTAGANRALAWAAERGALGLLLLNQDARIDFASFERLRDVFTSDSNLGVVFAKVVRADKPYLLDGLSGRRNFRHKLTTGLGEGRIDDGRVQRVIPVQHGHGAAMLLRVNAARAVGGFDEALFAYHDEVDLCWRLARAHYGVALEPRAVVRHHGPVGDPAREATKAYLLARNSLLVARKNGGRIAWCRVLGWAIAATVLYYGPLAWRGDAPARALLAGWRDGACGRGLRDAYRALL
jgi:GT2 family glycosyltransferase